MFQVNFRDLSNGDNPVVVFARLDDVVKACSLALNLHQISNVPHSVTVTNGGVGYEIILMLTTVDNDNKS